MIRAGIDIGGTKIRVGLVTESGKLLASRRLTVAEITDLTAEVSGVLRALCRENDVDRVGFCGIGIPGTVSADGRRIEKTPNIAILTQDFADQLSRELGISCRMVQDSRAAAWGEYVAGAARGKTSVICVTLGTGIGTGIVLDGRIYGGALGYAGEMGHLPVKEKGRECGCGKRGCLEKYAAGLGLDCTAAEILGEGKTLQDLFAAASFGNVRAAAVIEEAVLLLGRALTAEINLLSPDCLLLSGGLAQCKEYVEPVMEYVRTHCYSAGRKPYIGLAALGENAPLIGAAMLER